MHGKIIINNDCCGFIAFNAVYDYVFNMLQPPACKECQKENLSCITCEKGFYLTKVGSCKGIGGTNNICFMAHPRNKLLYLNCFYLLFP